MRIFGRQDGRKPGAVEAQSTRVPVIVATVYAAVSALWIAFSDRFVSVLASGYDQYQTLQTLKGWLFVAVTAMLLYLALRSAYRRILGAYQNAKHSEERLELALTSAGGGVWDRDLTRERDVFFSPQLKQLIGLPADSALTLDDWSARIHPEDDAWIVLSERAAISSGGRQIHDVRYRVKAEGGNYLWVHSRGRVICDENDKPTRMIGVILDVTAQLRAQERIDQLTHYDAVSGLANSGTFLRQLESALIKAKRQDETIAVAQIRIEDFNELLDEFAAEDTNKIVQSIGQRLNHLVGSGGLTGRLSQDAFAIATAAHELPHVLHSSIDNIATLLDRPIRIGQRSVRPSLSIGAALGPHDGESAHVLVANSNRALTKLELSPHHRVCWFAEGMDVEFRTRNQRLRDLRVAVNHRQLQCHFQPIVGLSSARTIGFEALARWSRASEGAVPPDQFIRLAEESGCIFALGEEILWQACREARNWESRGGTAPFVAVNVSPRQLDDPEFPSLIERVLSETGLPPERLELEVTENALFQDFEAARSRVLALRNMGVAIAMDDFGTGYSSLSTLSRLPFTRLKIDRSFVAGYGTDAQTTAIVDATLLLCDAMGLSVTAEGIETKGQAGLLRARGVQAAQGYHFARPMPPQQIRDFAERDWSLESLESWTDAEERRSA